MKKIFMAIMALAVMLSAAAISAVTASAASFSDAKNGVVYIQSEFCSPDNDTYIFYDSGLGSYRKLYKGETVWKSGSGFAIGKEGEPVSYIVTNAHVVLDSTADGLRSLDSLNETLSISSRKASDVTVYFSYGANEFMHAQIYMVNEEKDICVLKLPQPTDKRNPLTLCRSSDLDMDDDVAALGFPGDSDLFMDSTDLALDINDITVTRGAISRKTTDDTGREVYLIDVDIRHGNSGGPLVNSKGEVVGINTFMVYTGDNKSNYALIIDELINMINRDTVPYTLSSEKATAATVETTEAVTEAEPAPVITEPAVTSETAAPVASEASENNNTVIIIIIAAAVVAVAVAVVIAVTRGKKSPAENAPAAAQPSATPVLKNAVITGVKGIMAGRSFDVGSSVIIGRNTQKCTICFPVDAKGISGVHCEIRLNGGVYEIIDKGSSCGTFLGSGQKLVADVPAKLPSGTYFYLGSSEQLFKIEY